MSDEALQSMTESLTKIDSCLSDLIAERDRLKAENEKLRKALQHNAIQSCRIVDCMTPQHEATFMALSIRDIARSALSN